MEEQKIKDIFQKKLAEHESPVNPELWSQLSSQLPAAGAGATAGGAATLSSAAKLIITAAVIAVGITTVVVLVNNNDQEVKPIEVPAMEEPVEKREVDTAQEPSNNPKSETEKRVETETKKGKSSSASAEKQFSSKDSQPESFSENESLKSETEAEPGLNMVEPIDGEETTVAGESTAETQQENSLYEEQADSFEDEAEERKEYYSECKIGVETPMIVQYNVDGDSDFIWDFGDGNQLLGNSGSYRYSQAGRYTVTLFENSANGQKEIRSWEVIAREKPVIILPNVFTPLSSPGSNDFYRLNQSQSKNIASLNLRIFSKDGELVYESDDPNFSWDGKDRYGNPLSPGMYLAVAEARNAHGDKTIEQQTIYLKR